MKAYVIIYYYEVGDYVIENITLNKKKANDILSFNRKKANDPNNYDIVEYEIE